MLLNNIDKNLEYFQREIDYIKNMTSLFSQQYPKIARRLGLESGQINDPHVGRLVESFAYVSAKLNQEIDDEFPRITNSLLSVLYPQFTTPVPSLSVAQFQVDEQHGPSASTATKLGRGTSLFAQSDSGDVCRFQTCYDMDLWPIVIDTADIVTPSAYGFSPNQEDVLRPNYLRLRLRSLSQPFGKLNVQTLRFYIQGSMDKRHTLLEALFRSNQPILVAKDASTPPIFTPKSHLSMVGFDDDQSLVPQQPLVNDAYRILQEFFIYPSKFFFFDLKNLDFSSFEKNHTLDVLVGLENKSLPSGFQITNNNVLYGCTPIVNMFKNLAEPISLNHRQSEYPLIADVRDEMTQEIHTILDVHSFDPETGKTSFYAPYFFFSDKESEEKQQLFWTSRRFPSRATNMPGTSVNLSFVNLDMSASVPDAETVYADTLCTNRSLATQLDAGTVLHLEDASSLGPVICLDPPSQPLYPATDASSGWKMITQLSLNQLSLTDGPQALDALKELLLIHTELSGYETSSYIDTLLTMRTFPLVRRFGSDVWRGFARGQGVEITVADNFSPEYNPFLLTAVLQNFFKLYADINSFVDLSVRKRSMDGLWKQWSALQGALKIT